MRGRFATTVVAVLLAAGAAACGEKLSTPSDCPELCPSEQVPVQSIVVEPTVDTVFPQNRDEGYVDRRTSLSIRVTTYDPAAPADDPVVGVTELGLVGFSRRPDSATVRDTLRPIVSIDSIAFTVGLQGRDSTARNLALVVYRAPAALDTTASFGDVAAALDPANLVDTLPIADTARFGTLRTVFTGDEIARLGTAGREDSLVLAFVASADRPTGVRLVGGSAGTVTAPRITVFARVPLDDTTAVAQVTQSPRFRTFVPRTPEPVPPGGLLAVGGVPATRVFLGFRLPPVVRDSARVVRATLELVPEQAFTGLRGDTVLIEARVPIIDLGPKSPLYPRSTVRPAEVEPEVGSTAPISLEVTRLVRVWQADTTRPSAIVLSVLPEGASFTRGIFHSVASPDPALRPRIRIDYVLPFDFEAP